MNVHTTLQLIHGSEKKVIKPLFEGYRKTEDLGKYEEKFKSR